LEALLEEVEARPVQALEEPPSAARRAVTALFFVNGMLLATWVSRIPAIEGLRGLNHAMFGLALLVVAAGAIVSMPIAGALSASIGTGRICQYSALTYCLVLPLLALIPSPAIWGLALFVFGAGHGALDVAMNAQAVAIEKRYHRPIMSSFHALFSIGGLTGAVTGGLLATLRMRPETHFCLIAAVLGVTVLATFPHLLRFAEPRIVSSKKSLTFRLPDRGLIALGVVALCTMMGEGAMADWSAVYLKQTMGTSEGLAAVLASIGFACVGAGFATIVPMVFSAAGRSRGIAPGVAMATVTTMGYFGFLAGPPFIGITAELLGLRCALGIIAATSLLIVILSPALRRDGSSAKGVLCLASRSHGPN
jgi:MFS family permease